MTFLEHVARHLDPNAFRVLLALTRRAQKHTEPDGSVPFDLEELAAEVGLTADQTTAALLRLRDTPIPQFDPDERLTSSSPAA